MPGETAPERVLTALASFQRRKVLGRLGRETKTMEETPLELLLETPK